MLDSYVNSSTAKSAIGAIAAIAAIAAIGAIAAKESAAIGFKKLESLPTFSKNSPRRQSFAEYKSASFDLRRHLRLFFDQNLNLLAERKLTKFSSHQRTKKVIMSLI